MSNLLSIPSPITRLEIDTATACGVELHLKKEYLIHPHFGGNKWRKLKYNLEHFSNNSYSHLVTFGGPFSNHIAATASICQTYGIKSVGLIRGNYVDENNPTLNLAKQNGMELIHISKIAYGLKEASDEVKDILSRYSNPYVVPEGGSNALALDGVVEMMQEIDSQDIAFDHVVVAGGTGATAAGIISGAGEKMVTVINALRNVGLKSDIEKWIGAGRANWEVNNDFHFGGFARVDEELIGFINAFATEHQISLDPIYNGKAMFATLALMSQGYFKKGSRVLYIHTGGSQGVTAYNYQNKNAGLEIKI